MSRGSGAPASSSTTGLVPRRLAVEAIGDVLNRHRPLDDTLERLADHPGLAEVDRGLMRAIATATVRHAGFLRRVLGESLQRGWPRQTGPFELVMMAGAAQILHLDVPDHAAVDTAVALIRDDSRSKHHAGLANAILRTIARERANVLASRVALRDDIAPWLAARWTARWGLDLAASIAQASTAEPGIDISVKSDPQAWASALDALLLPTGSLRLRGRTHVRDLPGFAQGEWWVQDAAATLAARLLDPRPGLRILDMCAAPGGKTAQLAAAGAHVVALDRSGPRLARLREGMRRLSLAVDVVQSDALAYEADPFDAILLDAPCSATGTIRRHPEIPWVRTEADITRLAGLQARLLDKAVTLLRPTGRLVYATCSLEPEEGERQITGLLARNARVRRVAAAGDWPGLPGSLTAEGDFRLFPFMLPDPVPRLSGLDGFFVSVVSVDGDD